MASGAEQDLRAVRAQHLAARVSDRAQHGGTSSAPPIAGDAAARASWLRRRSACKWVARSTARQI
jgi:hypothetical protein